MVLTTIYVVRHGFRSSWTTDPRTGVIKSGVPTPTGIPADPALTAFGVEQAAELAALGSWFRPEIERVYSSAFYRCLQTVAPLVANLGKDVPLMCDRGIGEWWGTAPFDHTSPASIERLRKFFPAVTEKTSIIPSIKGESIESLHNRAAYALQCIIRDVDAASRTEEPKSIVISTHAATMIAIGRTLTGRMPEDPYEHDFHTYTCAISKFVRKPHAIQGQQPRMAPTVWKLGDAIPEVDWRDGNGVAGGWECELNAYTDHLRNGGERNWHFSNEESFMQHVVIDGGHDAKMDPRGSAAGDNEERLSLSKL